MVEYLYTDYQFEGSSLIPVIILKNCIKNFISLKMLQGRVDLVTFTEEVLNGELHFLCSVYCFLKLNKWGQQTTKNLLILSWFTTFSNI